MSLKAEIARLKAELAGRKVRPVNPVDLMTIDELDAELARLDAELLKLGMTPEEIAEITRSTAITDFLKRGYSSDNSERLSSF